MHQGIGVRGVLAFVDHDTLPAGAPQHVVFLDMRQVALGVKFLVLDRPHIPRADLAGLVPRQPPPSWRLRILAGRMRRDRLEFRPSSVLIFGFEFDDDSDQPPEPFSPTTPAEDDSSDEEGEPSEGEESARNRMTPPAPVVGAAAAIDPLLSHPLIPLTKAACQMKLYRVSVALPLFRILSKPLLGLLWPIHFKRTCRPAPVLRSRPMAPHVLSSLAALLREPCLLQGF